MVEAGENVSLSYIERLVEFLGIEELPLGRAVVNVRRGAPARLREIVLDASRLAEGISTFLYSLNFREQDDGDLELSTPSPTAAELPTPATGKHLDHEDVRDGTSDFPPPPIPIDQWIERDTDRPRSLHAWLVPVATEVAAGIPRDTDDLLIPSAHVLNTLKEVRDERRKVVKILGDSMHPTLRNGWKVLLDPARGLFQPGKIVMVYLRDAGTTIGMLARGTLDGEFKIVKRNPDYGGPIEIELAHGEWYPIGTVTTIVEAPIEVD